MDWRRRLLSTNGRSLIYGIVGAGLFFFVIAGFISAWGDARHPPPPERIAERPQVEETPDTTRHVPPQPVTYPFF